MISSLSGMVGGVSISKTSVIDCRGYRSSFDVILFPMVWSLASHDRHVV
jgi:hypothetical protein